MKSETRRKLQGWEFLIELSRRGERKNGQIRRRRRRSNLVIDPDFRDPFFNGDRQLEDALSLSISRARKALLCSSEDQRGERERCSSFRFLIIDALLRPAMTTGRKARRDLGDEKFHDRLDGGIDVVSSRAGFPRFRKGIRKRKEINSCFYLYVTRDGTRLSGHAVVILTSCMNFPGLGGLDRHFRWRWEHFYAKEFVKL